MSKCPCARAVAGTGGRYVGSSIVIALLARRWILHSDILFLSLLRDASEVVGAQTFEMYPEPTFEYSHAHVRFPICPDFFGEIFV